MDIIQEKLKVIESYIIKQQVLCKEVLTIDEAAIYLGLSKSALYKLTCKKVIPYYVPGGKKIYFSRKELDSWVFKNKIPPESDFILESENYLRRTPKSLLS